MSEAIDAIEVIEARQVIEVAIVRFAALRRSEVDVARLRSLVLGMRQSKTEPVAFAEFDFALHLTLSRAADNALLAARLVAFHPAMQEMMNGFASRAMAEGRIEALVESHAQLVEAIRERDCHEATRVFSDMMAALRIESGRCQPQ
ncbi:MAG: FCD domain-containing protein [Thermoleophilia bacterium]|nr:FCD domain-containing protein [Thermoleophilia bacterium]